MKEQIEHYENKLKYEIDSYDVFEALNLGESIVVVDARSSEAYAERHIAGAISLPHRTMGEETTSRLYEKFDLRVQLIYLMSPMTQLNNIPVIPGEPSVSPPGSLCFYAAHRHTHHTGSATFRAICSAVD